MFILAVLATFGAASLVMWPRSGLAEQTELERREGIVDWVTVESGPALFRLRGSDSFLRFEQRCGDPQVIAGAIAGSSAPVVVWVGPKIERLKNNPPSRTLTATRPIVQTVFAIQSRGRMLRTYAECEASWIASNTRNAIPASVLATAFWVLAFLVGVRRRTA
jgi:hypothetical protein